MRKFILFLGLSAFALFLLAITLVNPVSADLPPRPIPPPAPTDVPQPRLLGGWIQLQAQNAKAQGTVVQWQDSAGNWVNVESWRGAFDAVIGGVGTKTWWVDQSTFGPTPYRWVVYDPTNNQVVATSAPFNLPSYNKQVVTTAITLAP